MLLKPCKIVLVNLDVAVSTNKSPCESERLSHVVTRADLEGGGAGGPVPAKKTQKYRVFSNTGPDHIKKSQSYQASIKCWAVISTPAKRHSNGVSLAGR